MSQEEIVKTSFRLPKSLHKAVQHYATDHDMSDGEVLVQAIRAYLGISD